MAITDQVDIYNQALLLLEDGKLIQSTSEESTMAKRFNIIYPSVLDELLEAHPWRFCVTRTTIAALAQAPAFGWVYQYPLPEDCLKIMAIRDGGCFEGLPVKYELESLVQDSGSPEISRIKVLLTNEAAPLKLRYHARVTDTSQFSPLFTRALIARLALTVAHGSTGKQSYVERVKALYDEAIRAAVLSDDIQGTHERPRTSNGHVEDWVEARSD